MAYKGKLECVEQALPKCTPAESKKNRGALRGGGPIRELSHSQVYEFMMSQRSEKSNVVPFKRR